MIHSENFSEQISDMSTNTCYLTIVEDLTNTLINPRLKEDIYIMIKNL